MLTKIKKYIEKEDCNNVLANEKVLSSIWKNSILFNLYFWAALNNYWLNYWHILISKGTSGFTSNTLLIRIQYEMKYVLQNEIGGL